MESKFYITNYSLDLCLEYMKHDNISVQFIKRPLQPVSFVYTKDKDTFFEKNWMQKRLNKNRYRFRQFCQRFNLFGRTVEKIGTCYKH